MNMKNPTVLALGAFLAAWAATDFALDYRAVLWAVCSGVFGYASPNEEMSQSDFFTLYFASLGILGGLAGYVITHLLSEIKRLNSRVDEIYNILLDR
jgi:H+/Cl- antiporter ClcA